MINCAFVIWLAIMYKVLLWKKWFYNPSNNWMWKLLFSKMTERLKLLIDLCCTWACISLKKKNQKKKQLIDSKVFEFKSQTVFWKRFFWLKAFYLLSCLFEKEFILFFPVPGHFKHWKCEKKSINVRYQNSRKSWNFALYRGQIIKRPIIFQFRVSPDWAAYNLWTAVRIFCKMMWIQLLTKISQ